MKESFHFALDREDAKQLFGCRDETALRDVVQQWAESDLIWEEQRVVRCAACWPALHRCLSDGSLDLDGGEFPLNHVFLGGRSMANNELLLVALVRPDMVPMVAQAMASLSREELQQAYENLEESQRETADFEAIWNAFETARDFFARSAEQRHAVAFAEMR